MPRIRHFFRTALLGLPLAFLILVGCAGQSVTNTPRPPPPPVRPLCAHIAAQTFRSGRVGITKSQLVEFGALFLARYEFAPWGVVVWTFELEQDGETVSGTSEQGMGTLVLSGDRHGQEIAFVVDLVDGPHALSLEFTGGVEAGDIAGTVEFEDGSHKEWTLTKREPARDR